MSTRRTLQVFLDSARMEAALMQAAATHGFVDASGYITWTTLVDWARVHTLPTLRPADAMTLDALVGRLAPTVAQAFGGWAESPAFARATIVTIAHLEERLVTPGELERAGRQVSGLSGPRILALSQLWAALNQHLAAQSLVHAPHSFTLMAEALTHGALPALQPFNRVEIQAGPELTPARLAFIEALARQCHREHRDFELQLPTAEDARIDLPLTETLQTIERRWAELDAQLALTLPRGPLNRLVPSAFAERAQSQALPALEFSSAADDRSDAEATVRRVVQQLRAGVPPERIAIVQQRGTDTTWLRRACAAEQVPLKLNHETPLSETHLGQLVLSLATLADDGFPSDDVLPLLESAALPRLSALANQARHWVAQAGVVNDTQGAVGGRSAWEIRLSALEQRLQNTGAPGASQVGPVLQAVQVLKQAVSVLPPAGTARALLEQFERVLGALLPDEPPDSSPASRHKTELVPLALLDSRHRATFGTLTIALKSCREALAHSGFSEHSLTRRQFARWLQHWFSQARVVERAPRTGAVQLLEPSQVVGRHFDALFLRGFAEGQWPAPRNTVPLLTDDECFMVNRAATRPLFRLVAREGDTHASAAEALDRFTLHAVLSSAERVWVSRARVDAQGREALPSPWLQRLSGAIAGFTETHEPARACASLTEATTDGELRVRTILETVSPGATRLSAEHPATAALRTAVASQPWVERAVQLRDMEFERLRFFSDETLSATPFSGLLSAPDVRDWLSQRLRWNREHPVSASQLETFAHCHFKGYLEQLLRLREPDQVTEDTDFRRVGTLTHEVLRQVIEGLTARHALQPLDEALAQQLTDEALATMTERIERQGGTGHHQVWALRRDIARDWVLDLLRDPERLLPFGAGVPTAFEYRFGDPKMPERAVELPPAFEGETAVALQGSIDRLDALPMGDGVVDYKTKTRDALKRDELDRHFQLPLYAFAARQLFKRPIADAALVPTQLGEPVLLSKRLGDTTFDALLAIDGPTRTKQRETASLNFANNVFALQQSLRSGDVSPRSPDCRFCDFKRVCRLSNRQVDDPRGDS